MVGNWKFCYRMYFVGRQNGRHKFSIFCAFLGPFPDTFPKPFTEPFSEPYLEAFPTQFPEPFPELDADCLAPHYPFQMLHFHQSLPC